MAEASIPNADFHLVTLGVPRLDIIDRSTGSTRPVGPGKSLALITYLAHAPRRTAARDTLCDLLWGDRSVEQSRPLLRQTLWLIKTQICADLLVAAADSVCLAPPVRCDTEEFTKAIESDELRRAVSLYNGDFFSGYAAPGAGRFEEWANLERTRYRGLFIHAAESLARRALDAGRFSEVVALAQRMRRADPNGQAGWRLLLEARTAAGDAIGARADADQFEEWLRSEEWEAEPASIAAIKTARRTASVEVVDSSSELTGELVGREKEFSLISDAWAAVQTRGARVVHITADSGLGKTRLTRDILSRIRASRGRTRYVRANHGERSIPFAFAAAIAEGLSSLSGAAGIAPAAARTLISLNPALSSRFVDTIAPTEPLEPLRVGLALLEVIASIADERPVALVLDDMHWCDPASREALTVVASRLSDEKLLLVYTSRPQHSGQSLRPNAIEIRLHGLNESDISALVTSIARLPQADWASHLPRELHRATDGSPLRIMEALRFSMDKGVLSRAGDQWQCPDADALFATIEKSAILERRVSEISPVERSILLLLGVAGMPVSREIVAKAVALSANDTQAIASDLEMRGWLAEEEGYWLPAHDAIADAIIATTSTEDIRSVNSQLAAAYAQSSDFRLRKKSVAHFAAARRWKEAADNAVPHLRGFTSSETEMQSRLEALIGSSADDDALGRLRRELPLRFRRPTLVRNVFLVSVPAALVIAGFCSPALRSNRAEPLVQLAVISSSGDRFQIRRTPLDPDGWNPASPLRLRRAVDLPTWPSEGLSHAVARPGTHSWAIYAIYPDEGAGDIDLIDLKGSRTRLTRDMGDDRPTSFSPDGRKLLFLTTRWTTNGWADVAILDLASSQVQRVTRGDATYENGIWSPDGTSIAFTRQPRRRTESEICIAASDGASTHCSRIDGWQSVITVGWIDHHRLLVCGDSSGITQRWSHYDVDDGSFSPAGFPSESIVRLDPTGTWALTIPPPAPNSAVILSPSTRYDLGTPVPADSGKEVLFLQTLLSPHYLDSVGLETADLLTLGVPSQLKALGFTRDRRPVNPRNPRWRTLTPQIAHIDSLGVVLPIDTGEAVMELSAGGWRTTIDTLRVGTPQVTPILDENWDAGTFKRWTAFGEPKPTTVSRGAEHAFLNNGDGSFLSGAYFETMLDARRGIAMDFDVSTPLTQTQWQRIDASIVAVRDPAKLKEWDRRTGYLAPYVAPELGSCGFGFPSGEGEEAATKAPWFQSLRTIMEDPSYRLDTGKWYHVRAQLFPNGRCGIAINGRAVTISPAAAKPASPMLVVLQGHSVGSDILVGHLTLRSGVPTDIDWTKLQFDGTRWVNPAPPPESRQRSTTAARSPQPAP